MKKTVLAGALLSAAALCAFTMPAQAAPKGSPVDGYQLITMMRLAGSHGCLTAGSRKEEEEITVQECHQENPAAYGQLWALTRLDASPGTIVVPEDEETGKHRLLYLSTKLDSTAVILKEPLTAVTFYNATASQWRIRLLNGETLSADAKKIPGPALWKPLRSHTLTQLWIVTGTWRPVTELIPAP
jgi:hypothetical protein